MPFLCACTCILISSNCSVTCHTGLAHARRISSLTLIAISVKSDCFTFTVGCQCSSHMANYGICKWHTTKAFREKMFGKCRIFCLSLGSGHVVMHSTTMQNCTIKLWVPLPIYYIHQLWFFMGTLKHLTMTLLYN